METTMRMRNAKRPEFIQICGNTPCLINWVAAMAKCCLYRACVEVNSFDCPRLARESFSV
eukprot:8614266-Pyramimonas_sp.AAC.1